MAVTMAVCEQFPTTAPALNQVQLVFGTGPPKRSTSKARGEKLPAALIDIINRSVYHVPESYMRYKALERRMLEQQS